MGKLDPTAYDKWWRTRIGKEEAAYVSPEEQATATRQQTITLNTFGRSQVNSIPSPTSSPKGQQQQQHQQQQSYPSPRASIPSALTQATFGRTGGNKGGSIASRTYQQDDTRSMVSGPDTPASNVSYPRTPQFSAAGSIMDAEILKRLERLETDLQQEKVLRAAAEREMHDLLSRTPTPMGKAK